MTKHLPAVRTSGSAVAVRAAAGAAVAAAPASLPPYPIDSRATIATGWLIVLLTILLFVFWAAVAPLSRATVASGIVEVESKRKSVQAPDGGIVREILAREGTQVREGDPLVRFDDTQARAQVQAVRAQLDNTLVSEQRLLAERTGNAELVLPPDLAERAAREPQFERIVAGQITLFKARRASLDGQVQILKNRVQQAEHQIAGLELQAQAGTRQMTLIRRQLEGFAQLAEKGYASNHKVMQWEGELQRLIGERGDLLARMAAVRQGIGEAELQITQARKAFAEEVERELRDTLALRFQLEERLRMASAQLEHEEVRAPVSGQVVDLVVHTLGGVVPPGGRLMDIVPSNDRMVIEAQVRPQDIDGLNPGQTARIRFPAFDRRTTPDLHGRLQTVSADRLVDAKSGQPYFTVRVAVEPEELAKLSAVTVVPGMPAEVLVTKGERTLAEYLLAPLSGTLRHAMRE